MLLYDQKSIHKAAFKIIHICKPLSRLVFKKADIYKNFDNCGQKLKNLIQYNFLKLFTKRFGLFRRRKESIKLP